MELCCSYESGNKAAIFSGLRQSWKSYDKLIHYSLSIRIQQICVLVEVEKCSAYILEVSSNLVKADVLNCKWTFLLMKISN